MNDLIKQLIVGAMLALLGAIVGGALVALVFTTIKNEELKVKSSKPAAVSFQPSAFSGQSSVFSGQRMQPNQFNLSPRLPGSTNTRFVTSAPVGMKLNPTLQKLQEMPEVKKAREEFMEAQRRYGETLKKAVGAGTEVRIQKSEVSGQKTDSSGQPSTVSGQAGQK